MLIYNVTIQVTHAIHDSWIEWMKIEHIPEVMNTGCFEKYQWVRLLETDETEGITYAVQYYCAEKKNYESYIQRHAPLLRQKGLDKWGNQFIAFRSLMGIVN
jgi:hypothetical protein